MFIASDLNQEAIESNLLECLMLDDEAQEFHRQLIPSVGSEVVSVKFAKSSSTCKYSKKRVKTQPSAVREFHAVLSLTSEFTFQLPSTTCLELTGVKLVATSKTLSPLCVFLNALGE